MPSVDVPARRDTRALTQAQLSPIEPVKVALGPLQQMIWSGKRAVERSRSWLDMLPVPISTTWFDHLPLFDFSQLDHQRPKKEVVQWKTVDLLVPANAEIISEGYIPTDSLEPVGLFGEYLGIWASNRFPYLEVSCITHGSDAIYNRADEPISAQRFEQNKASRNRETFKIPASR
jgi:hypothetical protein